MQGTASAFLPVPRFKSDVLNPLSQYAVENLNEALRRLRPGHVDAAVYDKVRDPRDAARVRSHHLLHLQPSVVRLGQESSGPTQPNLVSCCDEHFTIIDELFLHNRVRPIICCG